MSVRPANVQAVYSDFDGIVRQMPSDHRSTETSLSFVKTIEQMARLRFSKICHRTNSDRIRGRAKYCLDILDRTVQSYIVRMA